MRKIVDIIALERELQNRIDVLNADSVFLNTTGATSKINALVERFQVVTNCHNVLGPFLNSVRNRARPHNFK